MTVKNILPLIRSKFIIKAVNLALLFNISNDIKDIRVIMNGDPFEMPKILRDAHYKIKKDKKLFTIIRKLHLTIYPINVIFNQNISQTQTIKNETILQISLNIEHSSLTPEKKKEAKQLLKKVQEELQKSQTNWNKITNLLKKSFDYDLKIAPAIVKLASAYYNAKL